MSDAFLAVDWGTTNRRVYRIEDGIVTAGGRDDRGARAVAQADYPAEVAAIRQEFGALPMLLAGMVGSTIGWQPVPYIAAPAGLAELSKGLALIQEGVAIIAGIVQHEPADVMRGEEVQLLGAAAAGLIPDDALVCQPGTHAKWVRMAGGRIASFTTAMTGELLALLRAHSILAPQLSGPIAADDAFRAGVAESRRGTLAASLFGIRARALLGQGEDGAAFASGLLIGADAMSYVAAGPIHVLGDEGLGGLYVAAIEALGGVATLVDSHAGFVAGIIRIRELAR
jgi:2-dehydro-3-deoxygalactonokinase